MSFFYPEEREITAKEVEAYAHACYDILKGLDIKDGHCKMYDPMTIEGDVVHSYVFDLRDGGRHHNYDNLWELKDDILAETLSGIKEESLTK